MSTLKELIDQYGLPLLVKRPTWYGTYHFRAEKLTPNGTASGTIFNNGEKGDAKFFRLSEEMVLFQKPAKTEVKLTDDKSVYDEENRNLQHIEGQIDELVEEERRLYAPYEEDIKNFKAYDYDDLEQLQALRALAEPHMRQAEEYRAYKPSPYFMRIDFGDSHGEERRCFVGKKGLIGEIGIIIHDWRRDVIVAARNAISSKFQVDGTEHSLYLRRSIDIKDGKIEGVKTEFESDTLTLDGEVIDPFLLSVLRDKKRNHKLTDIIQTIQRNQNEIISKPLQESFILQGCAGSGKTMILLHRLSYLLYNNKNYDTSNYCILTPNEFFDRHIDELSRELDIDKIKRYTVEGFYRQLIERLSADDYDSTQENGRWVRISKIPLPSAQLKSEKGLHDAMLSEIYSVEYQAALKRVYEDQWSRFEENVKGGDFGAHAQSTKTGFPASTNHVYDTYRRARAFCMELQAVVTQHEKTIREAKEGLQRIDYALPESRQRLTDTERGIAESTSDIYGKLTRALEETRQQNNGLEERLKSLVGEMDELQSQRNALAVTSTDVFTEREGQMSEEALTSYAYITSAQTAYAAYVREKCNDRITEISQAQSQLDAVPFYNFGKKASLKKWIEELTKAFESEVTAIMADYQRVMTPQLQKAQKALREIDETLASKRQLMRDTLVGQKQDQGSIQYFEDAVALFKADELKSVKHLIDVPALGFIRAELVKLEKLLGEIDGLRKTVETQNAKAEEYRESIKQCEASGIDEEFKRKLSELETVVGMVDAKNIYRLFMDSLRAVYEKHGCAYREKDLYRHKLYVALCMCALYYRDKKNPERHISIDEAQDIAVSEYRLLRGILGGNATFNLYGDVNQLVYAYKGISEWEALGEVISDQLFFLNENYRNTVQITEYCNKEFEAEVLAIGLDGEAVREDSLEEIVRDMREYRGKNPQARTAIIYKKGMEALAEQVQNRMSEDEYTSDLVDSAKVSLITVEMAKGLEFEKVAVIPDGMSVNEKYISYTRALESLAVISVPAEGSA